MLFRSKKAFSFGLLAVAVALSFLSCKNNNSDLKKVTKVSLSETIKIIEVGEEFTLKETVEPVDAVDRGVVWSSDKPNVAIVKDGKVKVVDPVRVTKEALQNAASIAGTAMTMGALVVDVPEKETPSTPDMSGMGGYM